jgi:hypothetical protein
MLDTVRIRPYSSSLILAISVEYMTKKGLAIAKTKIIMLPKRISRIILLSIF